MRFIQPLILAVVVLSEGRRCAPDLPTSALSLRASVTPTRVSRTHAPDTLRIIIHVRNPRPWPVDVPVGGPPYHVVSNPDSTSGLGAGYRIRTTDGRIAGPAGDIWGRPVYRFGPLQAFADTFIIYADTLKRRLPMPPNLGLAPGKYLLEPRFAHTRMTPIPFEVLP